MFKRKTKIYDPFQETVKQKKLFVIADGSGKGFGATDHSSPGGCHVHHLDYSKSKRYW